MEHPANVQPRKIPQTLGELGEAIVQCRRCPRLVEWRERMAREKRRAYRDQEYWGKPVPGFGDPRARVVAVGLAPGAHGSNRTGRMFTGDGSGSFLFPALHHAGFASRPESLARGDRLTLDDLFLTAVCRCAPPGNKPAPGEIRNCLPYLAEELRLLESARVIVALGKIAYDTISRMLRTQNTRAVLPPFAHGVCSRADRPMAEARAPVWVIGSYHPSRQNTQTGRLTKEMFDVIWEEAASLAGNGRS
jgi:uracil-DNA glycosylase family 4